MKIQLMKTPDGKWYVRDAATLEKLSIDYPNRHRALEMAQKLTTPSKVERAKLFAGLIRPALGQA